MSFPSRTFGTFSIRRQNVWRQWEGVALPLLSTLPDIWRLFLFFLLFFLSSQTPWSVSPFQGTLLSARQKLGQWPSNKKLNVATLRCSTSLCFLPPVGGDYARWLPPFWVIFFFSCWPVAGDKLCVANLNTASNTGSFCLHWLGRIIWKLNMKLTNPTSQQL